MKLRARNLVKKFGSNRAVDDVSFELDRPAMIGIIGRSGAGKSTLLRMMNRLIDVDGGAFEVDGRDVLALRGGDKRRWQADCAMIFQQFNLVPRLGVVSNVLHGTLNRHSTLTTLFNLYPRADIHRATDLLDRLGIAENATKHAEALSGGQQQRVAIAQAMMQDPQIDRVIGMGAGKIVFDGPADRLTEDAARDIYGADAEFDEATTSTSLATRTTPARPIALVG